MCDTSKERRVVFMFHVNLKIQRPQRVWNTKPSITHTHTHTLSVSTKSQAHDKYLWFYTSGLWGTDKVFHPFLIHSIINSCPKRVCSVAGVCVCVCVWLRLSNFQDQETQSEHSRATQSNGFSMSIIITDTYWTIFIWC